MYVCGHNAQIQTNILLWTFKFVLRFCGMNISIIDLNRDLKNICIYNLKVIKLGSLNFYRLYWL